MAASSQSESNLLDLIKLRTLSCCIDMSSMTAYLHLDKIFS